MIHRYPGRVCCWGLQLLGFWYWVTNQYIVQRVLGAKDIEHARWGAMFAGFLKVLPLFIMVIPGAMAIQLFPGLANPDLVFPTALVNILPVGMIGLVLAGLIAAIMSSVDSTLNSASTLIVVDFIKAGPPEHYRTASRTVWPDYYTCTDGYCCALGANDFAIWRHMGVYPADVLGCGASYCGTIPGRRIFQAR